MSWSIVHISPHHNGTEVILIAQDSHRPGCSEAARLRPLLAAAGSLRSTLGASDLHCRRLLSGQGRSFGLFIGWFRIQIFLWQISYLCEVIEGFEVPVIFWGVV